MVFDRVGNLLLGSSHFPSLFFGLLLKIAHFKEQQWVICSRGSLKRATVIKSLLSHFTKEQREWFFSISQANRSFAEKTSDSLNKNFYVFDKFPSFSSLLCKKQIVPVALYKIAMWTIRSFPEQITFSLFCSQKMSNLLKKPMSEFPTLVFGQKFGISPIVPRGTANNMQMHKILKKVWNWPTL